MLAKLCTHWSIIHEHSDSDSLKFVFSIMFESLAPTISSSPPGSLLHFLPSSSCFSSCLYFPQGWTTTCAIFFPTHVCSFGFITVIETETRTCNRRKQNNINRKVSSILHSFHSALKVYVLYQERKRVKRITQAFIFVNYSNAWPDIGVWELILWN